MKKRKEDTHKISDLDKTFPIFEYSLNSLRKKVAYSLKDYPKIIRDEAVIFRFDS